MSRVRYHSDVLIRCLTILLVIVAAPVYGDVDDLNITAGYENSSASVDKLALGPVSDCIYPFINFKNKINLTFDKALQATKPPTANVIGNGQQLQCAPLSWYCDAYGPTLANCTRPAWKRGKWQCTSNALPRYPLTDIDIKYQAQPWPNDFCVYDRSWVMIAYVEADYGPSNVVFYTVPSMSVIILVILICACIARRRRSRPAVLRSTTVIRSAPAATATYMPQPPTIVTPVYAAYGSHPYPSPTPPCYPGVTAVAPTTLQGPPYTGEALQSGMNPAPYSSDDPYSKPPGYNPMTTGYPTK